MPEKLQIWFVSDGKLGHQNQTEGLIQAIAKYRDIDVIQMPIISFTQSLPMFLFKKGGDFKNHPPPSLIIATGHRTHLSLLAYRRCFSGRAVIMMSPSLPTKLFDLCLIPRHDKPKIADHIVETIGAINRVNPSKSRVHNQGLILLGGSSKHFNWDTSHILRQIESLFQRYKNTNWIFAGSRRTPIECYDAITARFPESEIVLPENTSANWLPEKMQQSERIWITEDSISMIYEALTSGAKAGILRLDKNKRTRVTEEINRLVQETRISVLQSATKSKKLEPLYEADRCAKILLEKFDL